MNERVLLIDDEKDFVKILSERLSNREMTVDVSTSAVEGLDKAISHNYDAIVLDLKMPEMNGIEVLQQLIEKRPEMQVIILTGNATLEKGLEAMKLGAVEFIEKPVNINSLVENIHKAQANKILIVEKQTTEKIKEIMDQKGW